ncbi:MAG TPA: hemerythrin domain-containing protein [Acidimicrobiales bacterium]|jgi:hemerythrin-like domain-containing protein|nr:hemerythrin domain-containing protein [Acidimicrobiales bacterium]
MDAIAYLKSEHREVNALFTSFEKAGERAFRSKRKLVDQMIEALSQHASIEEQVFYPAVREAVPAAGDDVLEALEEHHVAKWLLSELDGMDPTAERFTAKVTVLIENVRHHVEEEEHTLFPEVRAHMSRKELQELGDFLRTAKRLAPSRPHPRSPDEPPGNLVVGAVAGALDKARSALVG